MQSFLQQRRIRKQLEKQLVVRHEPPDDVWTHERRYHYRNERIESDPRELEDGDAPGHQWKEHGQRTPIAGPTLEPRHRTRSHLQQEGDVDIAAYVPEFGFQTEPSTINTRDTLGSRVDMMLTGVERSGSEDSRPREVVNGADGVPGEESKSTKELVVVTYEGDTDPMDPHNWSLPVRMASTALISLVGAVTIWSSTINSAATPESTQAYHTRWETERIPSALFLIFLGVGGLVAAPISEVVGRNPVYIACLPPFTLFSMGSGLTRTLLQRAVCRAFAGLFGSGPLVASSAALVDLWSLIERIYAFPFYILCTFLAAITGPIVGSLVTWNSSTSWRYVDWLTVILSGLFLALVVLFLPETYSPVLLHWKAKQIRRLTGDDRFRAPSEFHRTSFNKRLAHALFRPFVLFCAEPIIMIFSGYLTIIFIILYTFSAGYPAIFESIYKLNGGQVGATFVGLDIGVVLAIPLFPFAMYLVRRDIRRARSRGQSRPDPETNLYKAMIGAPLLPLSLFWMGWTSRPSISLWCPIGASVVFGLSVLCIFISTYQYVAATFERHTASALASLQLFRLIGAGVMVILAKVMYHHLGVPWTLTTMGLIASVFMPVPFLLYRWGDRVRRWSRRAMSEED